MSALAALQRAMIDAVFARDEPRDAGLAVYRANVLAGLHDALAAAYPVVRRLVGEPFFREAARRYSLAHASTSGDLHEFGATFPVFLEAYEPARKLPYLADVARLEWAVQETALGDDVAAVGFAELARIDPASHARLTFGLHPGARLLRSQHPIGSLWLANQPSGDGVPRGEPGHCVLVLRGEARCLVEREWMLLARLAGGATLDQACDAWSEAEVVAHLGATLARLVQAGAFVSVAETAA